MSGIYIHIPFCVQKCNYCDFLSLPLMDNSGFVYPSLRVKRSNPEKVQTLDCFGENALAITEGLCRLYTTALLREIEDAKISTPISTIYIGGGTPTALPSHLLCKILDAVVRHCEEGFSPMKQSTPCTAPGLLRSARNDGPEVTVEANPGTLSREYLTALKAHGVNRLSMGLQTTKPHLLRAINRLHTMEQFLENYHTARELGFENINIDLMFALPGQTMQDWRDTLREVIALSPQHISAYSLTPAEGTPLWDALETGNVTLPGDETDRAMYHTARELLGDAGYTHYELSNFAKPGFESRHNVDCWRRVPYMAFGLGAHSFDGKTRRRNTEDMAEYLAGNHAPIEIEHLSEADHLSETMILGLRLTAGIPEENIPQIFVPQVAELTAKGLLARQNGHVCLTPKGMDLANQVFEMFM